jgi:hypothetical protein
MEFSVADEVRRIGYAFLPSFLPRESAEAVARRLGEVTLIDGHGIVHELRPKQPSEAGPNTYSGMYGTNMFPLHSDLAHWRHPPHFLMLRCLVGSVDVATQLLDSSKLLTIVDRTVLKRDTRES